jgi:hypothetical protein
MILENFENIIKLQDIERNFNGAGNSVPQYDEWQDPTHTKVSNT